MLSFYVFTNTYLSKTIEIINLNYSVAVINNKSFFLDNLHGRQIISFYRISLDKI
jgi:hypothetical protein